MRYKRFNISAITAIIIIVLLFPGISSGQLSGYEILKTEISARASSMGGAFVGISGDVHALFYNPAGLTGIQEKIVSFTYLDHVMDFKAGNIIFSSTYGLNTRYGIGIKYINYGTFEGRNVDGSDAPDYTPQDIVLTGGIAREYCSNLYYGVSGKLLYSKIASYSSTLAAVDGGIIYKIPEQMLTFGVSAANIGYVVSAYSESKDDMPAMLRGGFTKQLAHLPLLLSFEYRQFLNRDYQLVGGGEFTFSESFKGRLGYNSYGRDQKIGDEGGTLAGVSFGFGFIWQRYMFDYSFSSFGVIGSLQRLTFLWTF
ncbi:hypothetical protein AMJ80_05830 [bacterium SM23_31]|nr:MAG: hypothetical protein AMJ80_05830 [bacterium SM23_31]